MPLHFVNEDKCKGVRMGGGTISHTMNEVEISCLPADLPEFIEVIQVYDTAFETTQEDDFTARTTWGIFYDRGKLNAMLLDRLEERLSFPDLRDEATESALQWRPDAILVEKKASGHSLIQELRRKIQARFERFWGSVFLPEQHENPPRRRNTNEVAEIPMIVPQFHRHC